MGAIWTRRVDRHMYVSRGFKMADEHEEGPIHQSPWVFYLTVAICYSVLAMIMLAKWAAEMTEFADIGYVFAIQAGMLAAFMVVFGSMLYVANKLLGAATAKS
jgi:hypothetical protein